MHHLIPYEEMLRVAGYRVTKQREYILDAVCAANGHTTLKQIYMRAHSRDATLNQSSVYRSLKVFASLGIVVAGITPDGDAVYDIAPPTPHHHLVCECCGAEFEIGHELVSLVFQLMQKQYDFRVTTNHMTLWGRCATCQITVEDAVCPSGARSNLISNQG